MLTQQVVAAHNRERVRTPWRRVKLLLPVCHRYREEKDAVTGAYPAAFHTKLFFKVRGRAVVLTPC